jgi:hypothetical protein
MAQQQPSPQPVQQKSHDEDEIVHTPTRHRARWIMGILLLVIILTTFTVGDEITGLMTGRAGRSSAYARWNRPGVGEQSIKGEEWQAQMRSLNKLYSVLGRQLQDSEMKATVAQTLLVGVLAEDAGVAVTDKELGEFIVARFGNAQNYQLMLPQYRITPKEFESTLRQQLVVERYTSLMSGAWNTPDVAEIEKTWKSQHQEYAFDYVVLPVEQVLEQAKAAPISDEELHAYFDGLPQPKKDSFRSKEKIAADVAGMPFENASGDALFAKFPKPTDEAEIEKQARAYFDGFGLQRFAGKTYEESKERARAEALVYGALGAWLADMRARLDKGLAVNLAADGSVLGLTLQHMPAALEQSEWIASKPEQWLGPRSAALVFGNATDSVAGKFYPSVILGEAGFAIIQLTQKQEPALPAFEQLADRLREEMWHKRAKDLALARLEALRDQFGTRPPPAEAGQPPAPAFLPEVEEAKFYEVARAAGLEAKLRDFKERASPSTAEAPAPIDMYARTQPALYSAKPSAVPPAGSDFEGKNAFLLRVRGARDPDPARMKANEFAGVSASMQRMAGAEFGQRAFSLAALQSRYGLTFNEKQSGE